MCLKSYYPAGPAIPLLDNPVSTAGALYILEAPPMKYMVHRTQISSVPRLDTSAHKFLPSACAIESDKNRND